MPSGYCFEQPTLTAKPDVKKYQELAPFGIHNHQSDDFLFYFIHSLFRPSTHPPIPPPTHLWIVC